MAEITVFGDADPRALEQIRRCAEAEDGALGVLCADNHVGYSQPIGGAVAYENHISVSGVGFDIGCIAVGSRVSTADGAAIAIEAVRAEDRALCWDGDRVRTIDPHFGAVAQGAREVVLVRLENGRELSLTPDHEVMTPLGWIPAGRLGVDHRLACTAVDGEVAWVPVVSVEPDGVRDVYDVVTDDPAGSFIAGGIVVHNCGNKGVRTPLQASEIDVPRVMDEIARRISFGVGRANEEPVDHPVLDKIAQADFAPQRKMIQAAREQLGTVGGGNHYVDLFEDEDDGRLWIGVHFGSRGFGHKTASGFLALAAGRRFDERVGEAGMDAPPVLLDVGSELGQAYVAAMNLALDYAYAGRDVVVDTVLDILGTTAEHEVHNNHNYAALEEHFGRRLWVVRKGCTPAFPGQEGFVGGSMGGLSVILAGRESDRSAAGLYSTVHGAGRVMSRRQAAGKVRRRKQLVCRVCGEPIEGKRCPRHPSAKPHKTFVREQVSPGAIDWPSVRAELATRGIELRGGAADEAPGVYKQLEQVIAAHGDTIEVRHRLRPIGVAMAGAHVVDPYKD